MATLVLSEGLEPVIADIIFVHGLRGDRLRTWTKDEICWPRDFLKDDVKNARIITWGYDSSIAQGTEYSSQSSIFGHAENLLADLAGERRSDDELARQIIFVGHSLGGLVIKQALIRASQYLHNEQNEELGAIYSCTYSIMFLGTPHRGSDSIPLAQIIANAAWIALRRPNDQLLRTLRSESDVLEQQASAFTSITRNMILVCLYEEKPEYGRIIVPQHSACLDGFHVRKNSIPANHEDMCKFSQKDDVGYKRTSQFIAKFVNDIFKTRGLYVSSMQAVILKSLKFDKMNARHEQISEAHKHTFNWVFQEPMDNVFKEHEERLATKDNFVSWLRTGNAIYWICGKAGSGKSTMMKYILRDKRLEKHLTYWSSGRPYMAKGIFLWASGTQKQRSLEGLMRGIIHGLLQEYSALIPVALGGSQKEVEASMDEVLLQLKSLSFDDFNEMFKRIIEQAVVAVDVCLFIDGLDEYEGSPKEVLDLLLALIRDDGAQRIKLCVSSRPLIPFEALLSTFPGLRMQNMTKGDIGLYVQDHLVGNNMIAELRVLEKEELRILFRNIVEKASGVFLWVALIVDILLEGMQNGDRTQELQIKLDGLPEDLEDLYASMLGKVKPPFQQALYYRQAMRYFQLVQSCWQAPSILTMLLADPDLNISDQSQTSVINMHDIENECRRMALRLKSRCAGLLEVVRPASLRQSQRATIAFLEPTGFYSPIHEDTVQYLHRTVRDYIRDSGILSTDHQLQDPHELLLTSYILQIKDYLQVTDVLYGLKRWFRVVQESYWYARKALETLPQKAIPLIESLEVAIQESWGSINQDPDIHIGGYMVNRSLHLPPPMAMAAWTGLLHYLEAKISPTNYASFSTHGPSLLFYAVYFNCKKDNPSASLDPRIVKFLLQCGADPNEKPLVDYGCLGPPHRHVSPWQRFLISLYSTSDTDLVYDFRRAQESVSNEASLISKCIEIFGLMLSYNANIDVTVDPENLWRSLKRIRKYRIDVGEVITKKIMPHNAMKAKELKEMIFKRRNT